MAKSKDVTLPTPPKDQSKIQLPVLSGVSGGMARANAAADFLAELDDKSQPSGLPIVTISHDSAEFVMPSGEQVESISGYVIGYFSTRRYYQAAYSPGSSAPPDCWSATCIEPHPTSIKKQSPTCMECPHSQFGSARDGKSQACAVQSWFFLLNPAFGSPPVVALVCPPSSIKVWMGSKFRGGYLSQARAQAGAFQLVFTEVTLEKVGKTHCVCVPQAVGICTDPAERKQLAALINFFNKPIDDMRGQTPRVHTDVPESDGDA